MTTITLNIKDESKTGDVLRFLRDIDFLEVSNPVRENVTRDSSSSFIEDLLDNPLAVAGFSPMTRKEIYEC